MKLKKILSAVAVIGMLACTSVFAANTATLTYDTSKEYKVGDTVDVSLNITANEGIVSLAGYVSTTNGLTLTSVTDKALLVGGTMLNPTMSQNYYFNYNDGLATGNNTKTGEVAVFKFTAEQEGTYTITYTCDATMTNDIDYEEIDFGTATCQVTVKAATPTSTTSIGTATQGGDLDRQKTFYAPITIDTSKQSGARFWVKKGETEKSWEIPSGIVGVANFYAVVKTAETGTYTYNVVSSTGTAIGTAQTVTID